MQTALDCVPCLVRQALDAVRLVSEDAAFHRQLLKEVLQGLGAMDMAMPPPVMAQRIHRRIREMVGANDPYRRVKDQHNAMAMALFPELSAMMRASRDPLRLALRLAIAGNVIDLGAYRDVTAPGLRSAVSHALTEPLLGEPEALEAALVDARRILYLADNAGEIVFDRLLIERLSPARVTLVVRGGAVINDATLDDARAAGLSEMVAVMDNGSDAPGTLLEECSEAMRRRFLEADLVVSKGQGNYETLSDPPRSVFFLFKVKCPVIAENVGLPLGANVITQGR